MRVKRIRVIKTELIHQPVSAEQEAAESRKHIPGNSAASPKHLTLKDHILVSNGEPHTRISETLFYNPNFN